MTPIFITQIKFDGISERRLFLANQEVKKFAKLNDYKIIPLDEIIVKMDVGDFFDEFMSGVGPFRTKQRFRQREGGCDSKEVILKRMGQFFR